MKQETLLKISQVKRNNLTMPQKKFVAGVVSGQNPSQSAKIAYPTQTEASARVTATENMKKRKIQNAIERALIKSNLSEQRLTDIISDAIGTETPNTIDWSTKHRYIDTALRLKGYLNKDSVSNTQVNIGIGLD